ncbi:hypothetical protein QTP88_001773 [Uroleucon formosanum]
MQKVPSHKDKSKSIYKKPNKKQKTKVFFQDSEDSDVELKLCVNGPDNNDVVLLNSKELQVTNTEEEYKKPAWNDIKQGVHLLRRNKILVCLLCDYRDIDIQVDTDEDEGIIQVQGMANEKTKKHFSMKENDTSCISMDMVLTVLPEPILVQDNRKLLCLS